MLRLSKSVLGNAEKEAVLSVLQRGYLGMGPEVQAFETDLKNYLGGSKDVVCVNTGTAALHLALQALGVGPGDEVLVPSFTYVATFQAITATGATPVACDVHEENALLDIEDAAKRLTKRTKVLFPVHYASEMGQLDRVYDFARANGLRVLEDAAQAFGCRYQGKPIGSFGDVICFSFDGIKNITSGEGGAVCSSDSEVVRKVRDARLLGVKGDSDKRYKLQRSWDFDVEEQGWRYHMSDLMAAIGRVQLTRLDTEFAPKRKALARLYRQRLGHHAGIRLLTSQEGVVPHILPVRILNNRRDSVRQALLDSDIQVGVHYLPNHNLTKFRVEGVKLPVCEKIYSEILSLPLHPEVTEQDVERVTQIVLGHL